MKQFLLFSTSGGAGFITHLTLFNFLIPFLDTHLAYIVAFIVAVQVTYELNRRITFRGSYSRYWLYVVGQIKGFLINLMVFEVVIQLLPDLLLSKNIAVVMGSTAAMLFNYIFSRNFVFRFKQKQ